MRVSNAVLEMRQARLHFDPCFLSLHNLSDELIIMAKKKAPAAAKKKRTGRIILKTGEALVEAEQAWSAAEPEVVIGELDGPVGYAIAQLIGNQVKGHTKVFAILNSDVQIRPATVMVSKVTVNSAKYTNILMGTVQAAIAHGVLDAVREGHIPKSKVNDLGIIVSVWLDPSIVDEKFDPNVLFETNRAATTKAIAKALSDEPSIDWLLKNQDKVPHFFHQLALEGKLD
jgi:5,6,7,8-tetrahydromethanopterin hydro-lyase